MEVNNRVKKLRMEKDLSIRALAQIINMDSSFISHIERGKSNMSNKTVIKLANFFKVTPEYLLGSSDERGFEENENNIDNESENENEKIYSHNDKITYLKSLRINKGYSITELANLVGTQRENIRRLEMGAINVNHEIIKKLSEIFNVRYADLVFPQFFSEKLLHALAKSTSVNLELIYKCLKLNTKEVEKISILVDNLLSKQQTKEIKIYIYNNENEDEELIKKFKEV